MVILPLPSSLEEEVGIVAKQVAELGASMQLPPVTPAAAEIERVVTMFRELRDGRTLNGRVKLKVPACTLGAAEVISVMVGRRRMPAMSAAACWTRRASPPTRWAPW